MLRTRSSSDWLTRLDAEGVPSAPVLTEAEVIEQPQVAVNGSLVESEHPQAGRIRQPRPAARFDETPVAPDRPAPGLGAQSREVLRELGYPEARIQALVTAGVVHAED